MTATHSKLKISILLLSILLILGGGYFGLRALVKSYAEPSPAPEVTAHLLGLEDIVKISYTKDDETLSFAKGGNTWYYIDDIDLPLDQALLSSLESLLVTLSPQQTISSQNRLESYGLSTASESVTLTAADGTEKVLLLGSTTTGGGCYLLCSDDRTTVYTVGSELKAALHSRIYDYVSYAAYPAISAESISSVTKTVAGEDTSYHRMEIAETNADEGGTLTDILVRRWFFANEQLDETRQASGDALAELLASIRFAGCIDYSADETERVNYGLADAALYTITCLSGQEELSIRLAIGDLCEDESGYYAMLDDHTEVVLLPRDAAEKAASLFTSMRPSQSAD